MKPKSQFFAFAAILASLVLVSIPPAGASSIGGGQPTGSPDTGSGRNAAGTQQPARAPARAIAVPNIVVDEALLDRLSVQPVFLPGNLSPAQRSGLSDIARLVRGGNAEAARTRWEHLLRSYVSETTRGSDIEAILLYILKESAGDLGEEKKNWVLKQKDANAIADALSRHLRQLKELSRELAAREKRRTVSESRGSPGAGDTVEIMTVVVSPAHSRPGTHDALHWEKRRMDRTALQQQIRYVERKLAATGEEKEMATLKLQETLGKRTKMLNLLSSIMKKLNETATGVVRNLK